MLIHVQPLPRAVSSASPAPSPIPRPASPGPRVTVELSNTYADGHTSTRLVTLPAPYDDISRADLEQWWQDVVWPETGDGHPGDAHYSARIVRADHEPGLLTLSREWVG